MKKFLTLFVPLVLLMAACQSGASIDEPPEIIYGEDVCDRCHMIISDARYAAAYVTETGEVRRFDDVGDMLMYHLDNEEDVHLFWVHDFESETWLKADDAHFVQSDDLETPMGHGIAACSSREEAQALAAENDGEIFTFTQLLDEAAAGHLAPARTHVHDHSHHHGDQ